MGSGIVFVISLLLFDVLQADVTAIITAKIDRNTIFFIFLILLLASSKLDFKLETVLIYF
jgi:hypothetical protein